MKLKENKDQSCNCAGCHPEGKKLYYCEKHANNFTIGIEKPRVLIRVECTKKQFKEDYTLRGRIGIYIGVIIGLIDLKFIK